MRKQKRWLVSIGLLLALIMFASPMLATTKVFAEPAEPLTVYVGWQGEENYPKDNRPTNFKFVVQTDPGTGVFENARDEKNQPVEFGPGTTDSVDASADASSDWDVFAGKVDEHTYTPGNGATVQRVVIAYLKDGETYYLEPGATEVMGSPYDFVEYSVGADEDAKLVYVLKLNKEKVKDDKKEYVIEYEWESDKIAVAEPGVVSFKLTFEQLNGIINDNAVLKTKPNKAKTEAQSLKMYRNDLSLRDYKVGAVTVENGDPAGYYAEETGRTDEDGKVTISVVLKKNLEKTALTGYHVLLNGVNAANKPKVFLQLQRKVDRKGQEYANVGDPVACSAFAAGALPSGLDNLKPSDEFLVAEAFWADIDAENSAYEPYLFKVVMVDEKGNVYPNGIYIDDTDFLPTNDLDDPGNNMAVQSKYVVPSAKFFLSKNWKKNPVDPAEVTTWLKLLKDGMPIAGVKAVKVVGSEIVEAAAAVELTDKQGNAFDFGVGELHKYFGQPDINEGPTDEYDLVGEEWSYEGKRSTLLKDGVTDEAHKLLVADNIEYPKLKTFTGYHVVVNGEARELPGTLRMVLQRKIGWGAFKTVPGAEIKVPELTDSTKVPTATPDCIYDHAAGDKVRVFKAEWHDLPTECADGPISYRVRLMLVKEDGDQEWVEPNSYIDDTPFVHMPSCVCDQQLYTRSMWITDDYCAVIGEADNECFVFSEHEIQYAKLIMQKKWVGKAPADKILFKPENGDPADELAIWTDVTDCKEHYYGVDDDVISVALNRRDGLINTFVLSERHIPEDRVKPRDGAPEGFAFESESYAWEGLMSKLPKDGEFKLMGVNAESTDVSAFKFWVNGLKYADRPNIRLVLYRSVPGGETEPVPGAEPIVPSAISQCEGAPDYIEKWGGELKKNNIAFEVYKATWDSVHAHNADAVPYDFSVVEEMEINGEWVALEANSWIQDMPYFHAKVGLLVANQFYPPLMEVKVQKVWEVVDAAGNAVELPKAIPYRFGFVLKAFVGDKEVEEGISKDPIDVTDGEVKGPFMLRTHTLAGEKLSYSIVEMNRKINEQKWQEGTFVPSAEDKFSMEFVAGAMEADAEAGEAEYPEHKSIFVDRDFPVVKLEKFVIKGTNKIVVDEDGVTPPATDPATTGGKDVTTAKGDKPAPTPESVEVTTTKKGGKPADNGKKPQTGENGTLVFGGIFLLMAGLALAASRTFVTKREK